MANISPHFAAPLNIVEGIVNALHATETAIGLHLPAPVDTVMTGITLMLAAAFLWRWGIPIALHTFRIPAEWVCRISNWCLNTHTKVTDFFDAEFAAIRRNVGAIIIALGEWTRR